MLEFRKIKERLPVEVYLAQVIGDALNRDQAVLWLVAGGSAMDVAVEVAKKLAGSGPLKKLTVSLTDERYGDINHADSNWRQLRQKGFDLPGAKMLPVLSGKDMFQTAKDYSKTLNEAIAANDYAIALAGMGPDGHIFGIKPGSPSVEAREDVTAYDWDDYKRLTPTLRLLKKLDEVVIYAVGGEKHHQLDMLNKDLPALEQPAQQLKHLKKVVIFNDYKGESV